MSSLLSKIKKNSYFPDVSQADRYGVLAIGGDTNPELLLNAYYNGIFPWPHPDIDDLPWFAPAKRGVLFFENFRGRSRIERYIRTNNFKFSFNTKFTEVMRECASEINREIKDTWINQQMLDGYTKLHEVGFAHSLEVYKNTDLVGGVYGISIGTMFAAESMFFRESNASKAALLVLIDYLAIQGATWIDCQQLTKHLKTLGGIEISRKEFMKILKESVNQDNMVINSKNLPANLKLDE